MKKIKAMFQIQGSKSIESQERTVSSFIKLHLNINGDTEIIQSDEEKVVIIADDNLQKHVQAVNSGRTLYITQESGILKALFSKLKVQVYVRQIDTIINNCHGNVTSQNQIISREPFYLECNSHGNTRLDIKAPSFKGLIRCNGNVELSGETGETAIKTMMNGNFLAKELHATKLTFKGMSNGNTEIYASEQLSIKHMCQGYIHYYGAAVLKDVNIMGTGEVTHKE
jgi:hypothetical protein